MREDDGAADNLSTNSDPDPIVELAGAEDGKNSLDGQHDVIREEDIECEEEPASSAAGVMDS